MDVYHLNLNVRIIRLENSYFLMSSVLIPSIQKCISILGGIDGKALHNELLKSEFRLAESLGAQIKYIKKICPSITVRNTIKLLGVSNDRYYDALNNDEKKSQESPPTPLQKLLTEDEENEIITNSSIQQMQNDCMSGKEIRILAAELYKKRTGEIKEFSIEEVNRYFDMIDEMMKDPPNPFLLINFDEIGFGKRPQKGKRKDVYIVKNSNFPPFWRETTDPQHVSVVVGISAACCSITPLFLSTRKKFDDDLNNTLFLRSCNYYCTKKGYMTILSTVYWVRNNLSPYVQLVRSKIGLDQKCVIIADGLKAHLHQIVMEELDKIGNVTLIPLPSHSSHLTQMLDVSIFSVFKGNYNSTSSDSSFTSLFTRKLMHIKKAFQSTFNDELIKSGWEKAGFIFEIEQGDIVSYQFSEDFKEFIRSQAIHEEPHQNE